MAYRDERRTLLPTRSSVNVDIGESPSGDRTTWAQSVETPLRLFLRTETGSAALVLASAVAALVWANIDAHSYERVWNTMLSVRVGGVGPYTIFATGLTAGSWRCFFTLLASRYAGNSTWVS